MEPNVPAGVHKERKNLGIIQAVRETMVCEIQKFNKKSRHHPLQNKNWTLLNKGTPAQNKSNKQSKL